MLRYCSVVSLTKRPSAAVIALGLLAVALGVVGVIALRSASFPSSVRDTAPATAQVVSGTAARYTGVPAAAWETLKLIDAGQWPPVDSPGTHGGDTWMNRSGQLARKTGAGAAVSYREWDVNRKQSGRTRDAERIITGSDGSAWYTGDHYQTFTRMR
jgi:ribonuclease T1